MKIITLMTDFGIKDPYIGIMKGKILSSIDDVNIVDITHSIPCGDIRKASFFLKEYYKYFPSGSVHIIVVDPFVGENSIPLLNIYEERFFLAPDNGVLTPVLGDVYRIYYKEGDSRTFFGRDIYAPFAVKILKKEYKKYIKRYDSPKTLEFKKPFENGNIIKGEVIHIDNFGNLITNIDKSLIKDGRYVKFKGNIIKIVESYSDVNEGETLALINSFNLLEIGVNLGNAEKLLKGKIGDKVYLIRRKNA
uniref:S-adenosyl-l-methionine hydroxide adenosyltransferase n=1 Tax=candidate division WOR-3 bacterium TaxID=2052148 RepID=A0A7C4UFQ1_UNCW3